eukprot:jgi/Bigna1/92362/estExt_fgenesh1_pm.C_170019
MATGEKHFVTLTQFLQDYKTNYSKKTVNRAGISNMYTAGAVGAGMVRKLDVYANETLIEAMDACEQVYVMASEESRDPIILRDDPGGYEVVFDPLDGSQNIDCNMSLGTIFGIYEKTRKEVGGQTSEKNVLKKGTKLVASGYVHYGAATVLVMTAGSGVHEFILDQDIGEFLLVRKRISVPRRAPIYSINESSSNEWDNVMLKYIEKIKKPQSATVKGKKSRYVGTMVADVHRSMLYGGLYLYPGTKKMPGGKVRLLYECNPIAFLMEQAGGKAFTLHPDTGYPARVMELQPVEVHQRIPFFCGSIEDMNELEKAYLSAAKTAGGKIPQSKL